MMFSSLNNVDTSRLPLLELFTSLRDAGLPLGLGEYQLLLQALQGGFGADDLAGLKRLCRTLWVKSDADSATFEYYFERVMAVEMTAAVSAVAVRNPASPRSRVSGASVKARKRWLWILAGGILLSGIGIGVRLTSLQPASNVAPTPGPVEAPVATQPVVPTTTAKIPNAVQINQPNQSIWGQQLGPYISFVITLPFVGGGIYVVVRLWRFRRLRQEAEQRQKQREQDLMADPSEAQQLPELMQTMEDEIQVAEVMRQSMNAGHDGAVQAVVAQQVFARDYLPLKQRQMKQCWRYLRLPCREGPSTELDVEATIERMGRQGGLFSPIMVPRRVNRMELLLLLDREGSMVPFHGVSSRLATTAIDAGRLGKSGAYYFRNYPGKQLYLDQHRIQAEATEAVLERCSPRWTVVMIVSDGGAVRGGFNSRRARRSKDFLARLQPVTRAIVWLNPMPKERWAGTTAEEIAHWVPMVEMSREGMQGAINVLRGRG